MSKIATQNEFPPAGGATSHQWCLRLVFVGALVLGAAQTLGPVLASPLSIDEQVTYYLACGQTPPTVFERVQTQSATPPLPFWLTHASMRLGAIVGFWPAPEAWLRLPSWCSFLLAMVVVRSLGDRLLGGGMGSVAALLLACQPDAVYHATQARPYSLGLLANLVAALGLLRLRTGGWRPLLLAGFLSADVALLWTHYLFAAILPAQLLMACLMAPGHGAASASTAERPLPVAIVAAAQLLAGLSLVLLAPALFRLGNEGPVLNWITERRPWYAQLGLLAWDPQLVGRIGAQGMTWMALGEILAQPLVAAVIAGILFGLGRTLFGTGRAAGRRNGRALAMLALWFVVPIYLLWGGSRLFGASLAQPRYFAIQAAPAVLLLAWVLRQLGRTTIGALLLALLLVFMGGLYGRVGAAICHPVQHDRYWLEAAQRLNELAKPRDLVLVQSGLVETLLVPHRFADAGFQEYTTSRLSDFYLRAPVRRLSLPLEWSDGPWLTEYGREVAATRASGGTIWLVISADSDLGAAVETAALAWLRAQRFTVAHISDERVAHILRANPMNDR